MYIINYYLNVQKINKHIYWKNWPCLQEGGRTRILNQGSGGGPAKGRKKKVTAPILMAEVVIRNFGFASDGSPGVQGVFELL